DVPAAASTRTMASGPYATELSASSDSAASPRSSSDDPCYPHRAAAAPAARPSPLSRERVIKRGADREDPVQAGDAQQLRHLGAGAERRTVMPSPLARRCAPISTASADTSQNDTPDRSRTSSGMPGRSTLSRRSRRTGVVAMSRSPSSLAM